MPQLPQEYQFKEKRKIHLFLRYFLFIGHNFVNKACQAYQNVAQMSVYLNLLFIL